MTNHQPVSFVISVRFAEEACAVMTSAIFSPCHFLVNPGPFQRFCRYDVCACGDGEACLCSALAAYAAACSARGVLLNWRSPSLCGKSVTPDKVLTPVKPTFCSNWRPILGRLINVSCE